MNYNNANCYGENNTNWADVFQNPDDQRAEVEVDSARCPQIEGMCSLLCYQLKSQHDPRYISKSHRTFNQQFSVWNFDRKGF